MDNSVEFDLRLPTNSKKLEVPLMQARGYEKPKVIRLFQKLQEDCYGEFFRGSRGRGNVGYFVPNDKCPEIYTMVFVTKKRGRPKVTLEGLI